MAEDEKPNADKFVLNTTYPDAASVFGAVLQPLSAVKDTAVIILDTNVLLVPFAVNSQTLEPIRGAYQKLASAGRLVVPGQVAREFARNRATKLAELYRQLLDRKSKLPSEGIGKHPLLENLPVYQEAMAKEAELLRAAADYGDQLTKIADVVRSWTWNDPVSELYRELFLGEVVIDPVLDKEEIERELSYRFANHLPPGYKDAGKPDTGVGDFLIWKTILQVAARKMHVIFVSGDAKSDWRYRSGDTPLYPRYELIDEFRRASDGKSFHIVSLADLLALYGADKGLVTEVRLTEQAEARGRNTQFNRHPLKDLKRLVEYLEQEMFGPRNPDYDWEGLQAELESQSNTLKGRSRVGPPSHRRNSLLVLERLETLLEEVKRRARLSPGPRP